MTNQTTTPRKVILVVDDVPANLALLLNHLRTLDYHVLVAESGLSALEQVQHIQPDIILLDVLMPGLDGYETCQLLKSNPLTENIPVIFVTALSETVDKVRGFEVGGVDFVTKPIEIVEVASRVHTHLLLHSFQQELASANAELQSSLEDTDSALELEASLRRQSQEDRDALLRLTDQQSERLDSLVTSIISNNDEYEVFWTLLHRPILPLLDEAGMLIKKLQADASSPQDTKTMLAALNRIMLTIKNEIEVIAPRLMEMESNEALIEQLSDRERAVLIRIASGENNEEIALGLNLASATVRTYRTRIMRKLDINDLPALVKFAVRHGLVPLN